MKILVAIESSGANNAEQMAHTTLRWAGRSGFNTRIFIPSHRTRKQYEKALEDASYTYYLSLPPSMIVSKVKPLDYAVAGGYDLLLYLPDNLTDWRTEKNDDKTVADFAEDVGSARKLFSKFPEINEKVFENGAVLVRVLR
jgi:hypothetical protein